MQNARKCDGGPLAALTKSQRKVLADLELFSPDGEWVEIPHRKLAQTTGLSRPTVLHALRALNDLDLISSDSRLMHRPARHQLLYRGSVRTGDGQIWPSARSSSTKAGVAR